MSTQLANQSLEKAAMKVAIGLIVALLLYLGVAFYSMTWGERLLRPVQPGMSQSEVRSLVGEPVRVIERTNSTVAWDYSKWRLLTDAVVFFDTNGLVTAVVTD
ncbi:MAG: outer membrane protein assembly factor BamE [Limisphaerales bacterium]